MEFLRLLLFLAIPHHFPKLAIAGNVRRSAEPGAVAMIRFVVFCIDTNANGHGGDLMVHCFRHLVARLLTPELYREKPSSFEVWAETITNAATLKQIAEDRQAQS
jgi:hypothetical protein